MNPSAKRTILNYPLVFPLPGGNEKNVFPLLRQSYGLSGGNETKNIS